MCDTNSEWISWCRWRLPCIKNEQKRWMHLEDHGLRNYFDGIHQKQLLQTTTNFGMSIVISQGKLPLPWNADKWATFILSVRGSSVEALKMLAEL